MVLVTLSKIAIILVVSDVLGEKMRFILAVVTDILLCLCGFNISPGYVVWQVYDIAADFLKTVSVGKAASKIFLAKVNNFKFTYIW